MSDFAMKHAMKKRMAKGGMAKPEMSECMACKGGMCMEHGGEVKPPMMSSPSSEFEDDDLVMKIMKKRYAAGGLVEPVADFESNDFDVLDKDPPEEFHDTGANSGDELGDEHEEDEDKDMVKKIMKSRAKKDRMPRPA